jgi:hypothetical protein
VSLRAWLVLLAAGVLAAGALAGAGSAAAALPLITVNYSAGCGYTLTVSGLTIDTQSAPGETIPPGPYQVQLLTPLPSASFAPLPQGCVLPEFSLSGPNVSWSSNLANGTLTSDQTTVTLLPSSTYTAVDANHPQTMTFVFSTAATGSSSSLLLPGASTYAVPSAPTSSQSLIGSAIVPYRGSLQATVSAPGRTALLRAGRAVGRLAAGDYEIVVRDASRRSGFALAKAGHRPITITTVAFEGSKTARVDLSAGAWTFSAGSGKPRAFLVG